MVDRQRCEQRLCGVCVTSLDTSQLYERPLVCLHFHLPNENPPSLPVVPEVRHNLNVNQMLAVCDASQN